ncbi:iron-siderophore ABC transporter substrate-binding protein [Salinicola sp. JS01]|uniref:ABC transporter substrate-binding protein n=1 Tax=Salinicola sp. JS01 TaxID=3050071 RepID=UPI00255BC96C|nr:iron-siderophore ABC transporter substrate-binding protein [Salinicola sp. JS01]WIX31273.1 iron-siderophore ABC transporter substrate-binding protein [Salinicola sp. JS01]
MKRREFMARALALGAMPTLALGAMPALARAGITRQEEPSAPRRTQRIVTLFQGATDTAVALGVVPVGVVLSWQYQPIYPYLRPALAQSALLGLETQPNLERIALLEPDLIVASRFRHQRIAPLLSALAPLTLLDDIYHYRYTLETMAQALDRQARAESLQRVLASRMAGLRARLQQRFGARWPLTVALLDVRAGEIRSYLAPSFGGSVLTQLGFGWPLQVEGQPGVLLTLSGVESLPALDADVFFLLQPRDRPAREHYGRLRGHPLWQRLAAVRQGRVWQVDPVAWSLSGGILGVFGMLDDLDAWLDTTEASA